MTMAPTCRIMVSIYICIIYPRLLHPVSRDSCMPWNAPCIPVYWRTHVHDLQLHALDWTARKIGGTHCLPWRRQIGECTDTWCIQIQPINWDSGAVAARQLANTPVWIKNDRWAYCIALCDVHIDKVAKLNLLQCLCVICGCRAIQTNSAEPPLALLHVAIVTI